MPPNPNPNPQARDAVERDGRGCPLTLTLTPRRVMPWNGMAEGAVRRTSRSLLESDKEQAPSVLGTLVRDLW